MLSVDCEMFHMKSLNLLHDYISNILSRFGKARWSKSAPADPKALSDVRLTETTRL